MSNKVVGTFSLHHSDKVPDYALARRDFAHGAVLFQQRSGGVTSQGLCLRVFPA